MTHTIFPSTSSVESTIPIPESALEVFELFFTPTIVVEIMDQTNRYAEEVMGAEAYVLKDKFQKTSEPLLVLVF